MLVYNIKRAINILGVADLIDKIMKWNAKYPTNHFVLIETTILKLVSDFKKSMRLFYIKKTSCLEAII